MLNFIGISIHVSITYESLETDDTSHVRILIKQKQQITQQTT